MDDDFWMFIGAAASVVLLLVLMYIGMYLALILLPMGALVIGYKLFMRWDMSFARVEKRSNRNHKKMYKRAVKLYSPKSLDQEIRHHSPGYVTSEIQDEFVAIGRDILADEGITGEVPPMPISNSGLEAAKWRDKIDALDTHPEVFNDIAYFFNQVGLAVPYDHIEGDLTVPLSEFITTDQLYEYGRGLQSFIDVINWSPSNATKEEIIASTPLQYILDVPVPFSLSDAKRNEHLWLMGSTGTGKTTLMRYLIAKDLPHVYAKERSIIVLESKGDLYKSMLDLEYDYGDQVMLLDVSDIEYPLALNMFAIGKDRINSYSPLERERLTNTIIELYEFVLSSLMGDASMTAKQTVVFRYITRLLLLIPDATLETMADLLEEGGEVKYYQYIEKLEGIPRQFFDNEFSDPKQFASTRKEVLRRLYQVLENKTFRNMFASTENKVDLFTEMNAGKIILIYADKSLLREEASQLFVRFIIAMISQASQERLNLPESQRTRTHIYIDEAHEFLDRNAESLLAQARASNIGLCVANQYITQLSPSLQSAFSANTNTKIFGPAQTPEARKLAPMLGADPSLITGLKRGEFAVWQKDSIPKAISVKFPVDPFADIDRVSEGVADYYQWSSRYEYSSVSPNQADPEEAPVKRLMIEGPAKGNDTEDETQDW